MDQGNVTQKSHCSKSRKNKGLPVQGRINKPHLSLPSLIKKDSDKRIDEHNKKTIIYIPTSQLHLVTSLHPNPYTSLITDIMLFLLKIQR